MIREQCKMVLTNIRFISATILVFVITFLLLYYQETTDEMGGLKKEECLSWAVAQQDPIEKVYQLINEIYAPNFQMENLKFADNQYTEMLLCLEVASYLEQVRDYEKNLKQIISQREGITNFPNVSAEKKAISQLDIQYYEKCKQNKVEVGNYFGFEKFFSFGAVEICLFGIIFLISYFLIVQEREKGFGRLVFASKGGGIRYFITKLCAIEILAAIAFVILFLGKAIVFGCLYGYSDISVAIQSMNGYNSSPYTLTIAQYMMIFLLWRLLASALFALLVLVICSLPLSEIASGATVFLMMGISILLKSEIAASSSFVLFRDTTFFQITSIEYWVKGLRSYSLFSNASKSIIVYGIAVPLTCMIVLTILLLVISMQIYYRGLRQSIAANRMKSKTLFFFTANRWWNEGYFVAIHRKILFAFIGITIFYATLIGNYDKVFNENVKFERQMVIMLNDKTFEEAEQWIIEKERNLSKLEESLIVMQENFEKGIVSEEVYLTYYNETVDQLRIKPLLEKMSEQRIEMAASMEKSTIVPKFEFTALSDQIYREKGWGQRNWIALMSSCFIVFCVMSLFPSERMKGIHRLLTSTKAGKKNMIYRSCWLVIMTFLISMILTTIWLYSLGKQYTWVGWNMPAQSWSMYRELGLEISIGTAIMLEAFWQCAKWSMLAGGGILLSLYFTNTAWTQLIGVVIFIIPLVLQIIGIEWLRDMWHVKSMVYGEMSLFGEVKWYGIAIVILVIIMGLKVGIKRWMEA